MTLPEAIRLGAFLKPQAKGGRMDGEGSCALVAASEAVGIPPRRDVVSGHMTVHYGMLMDRFPILKHPVALPEPVCVRSQGAVLPLYEVIYLLNDINGWTRQQIADWVESIEGEQETQDITSASEVVV